MTIEDIKRKNLILIEYLNQVFPDYEVKAEYSTNDETKRVMVVQEQAGQKVIFYDEKTANLNDYYLINIYGLSIQENKESSMEVGNLIGKSIRHDHEVEIDGVKYNEKWQIIFMQQSNPQAIMYEEIRRVGYTMTVKTIVNLVARRQIEEEENGI